MRATDTIRRRRERRHRAARPSRRVGRALTVGALLLALALVFAPAAALAAGAAGLLAFMRDLPDVDALAGIPARFQPSLATTRLYAWDAPDAEGLRHPVLIDEIADPRRDGGWVRLDSLPPAVVDTALAAAADPMFFDRPPADLAAALTEWWRTGQVTQAHSPLLRDLIMTHLRDDQPAPHGSRRALQDWFLGWQAERRFSRVELLEWTLNTTYYGHLATGIEAAARVYFNKGAGELTTAEAALLAAIGRDPAANPFDAPDAALAGRASVLQAMVTAGTLAPDAAADALAESLDLAPPPGSDSAAPAFARLARAELERLLGSTELLRGGWQVETTLDLAQQHAAECAIAAATGQDNPTGGRLACPHQTALAIPDAPAREAAVVSLDPADGTLAALAGDALTPHPTGDVVQPFIYLTALSRGYTAASQTLDVERIYLQDGRPYIPRNPDGVYLGPLRLREAVALNRAAPAAQVLSWVGVDAVLDSARALGLAADAATIPADLTFAQRGFPADLLRLSHAFAAVANGGTLAGATDNDSPRPATVRRVVDDRGDEVYALIPDRREALSAELAWLLTDMLSDNSGVALAAGISADSGDAWAVGYTAERLVGVRAAVEDGGADAAVAVRQALFPGASTLPVVADARPPGLRAMDVCALSGLLPQRDGAACATVREWFSSGTEPVAADATTREVTVNRETGRLATIFTPPNLVERAVYTVYPPELAKWAAEQGIPAPPIEYDTIRRVPTRSGGAAASSPEPWSVVNGQWSVIGSAGGPDFAYYRLSIFPGLLPDQVQPVVERSDSPVQSGELGVWDTTLVDDGLYTLLLTVVRADGTFNEVAIPVTVANNG